MTDISDCEEIDDCCDPYFRSLCLCNRLLYKWDYLLVCPQTGKILCFDCGQQKIKDARRTNSIDRYKRQKINLEYLRGFNNSLTKVELSGWHLFVQCIIKLHQSHSL